ncbi:thioredoxin-like protein [Natrinema hispanicum]|uniref:Thioredoxin-like protein n=2 Tax=Natrinema hispanicum TaxID=392421 RepID=A0A482YA08_9EURY|nr:thioredoxin-like protein [Natrinema hispanicum]
MFTIMVFVAAISIGYYSMNAAPVLSDDSYTYHGETEWRTDIDEARQVAAEEDKPILIYFWTTWCTYCEDYNANAYSDPAVLEQLDDFVLLAVNLEDNSQQAGQLQQRYEANYPPQHVAVTPDGEVLIEINGYAETDSFLSYLDDALEEWETQ